MYELLNQFHFLYNVLSEPPSDEPPAEPEPVREPSPEPEPEPVREPSPEPEPQAEEETIAAPFLEAARDEEEVVVNSNGINTEEDEHSRYPPRLCHVTKWPDFQGYGFNLHAERDKPGQFIGNIDADSPAEEAGLKKGDRIIEINGSNIENETHQQVIQRVKAIPNETTMLLLDDDADKYYKEKGIMVDSSMPHVVKMANKPRGKAKYILYYLIYRNLAISAVLSSEVIGVYRLYSCHACVSCYLTNSVFSLV